MVPGTLTDSIVEFEVTPEPNVFTALWSFATEPVPNCWANMALIASWQDIQRPGQLTVVVGKGTCPSSFGWTPTLENVHFFRQCVICSVRYAFQK